MNTTIPAVNRYFVMIQAIKAFIVCACPIIGMSSKTTLLIHDEGNHQRMPFQK
jgi:hypothetical protein